jgi:hypothetical protein
VHKTAFWLLTPGIRHTDYVFADVGGHRMLATKKAARSRNFDELARDWRKLAERRRDHLLELQRSGRWKRYFSEEKLAAHLNEANACIRAWSAGSMPIPTARAAAGEPARAA